MTSGKELINQNTFENHKIPVEEIGTDYFPFHLRVERAVPSFDPRPGVWKICTIFVLKLPNLQQQETNLTNLRKTFLLSLFSEWSVNKKLKFWNCITATCYQGLDKTLTELGAQSSHF